MNVKCLCINCMREKRTEREVCPWCGFDAEKYTESIYQLPLYTVLSERYIIGKVIGSGGFGITYIAFDIRLEIPVAVKELFISNKVRRENARTVLMDTTEHGIRQYQEMKNRFMQEAKTLAELENVDGLVKVKDYFQENDTAYIVMEYLHGKDLKKKLLAEKKRMSVSQTMEMLEPVMQALEKMHNVKIIHRDVSADNIMCLEDGRVKLIDLGGEKRIEEGEASSDVTISIKKSSYTPIEQILGRNSDIGPWTDVYALCACIYFCICGKLPKGAGDRKNDKDIDPPTKLGVKIKKHQEKALMKGLALDYKNRIQSIGELRREMDETASLGGKKAAIGILALLLAAGGIGGYYILSDHGKAKVTQETDAREEAKAGKQTEVTGVLETETAETPEPVPETEQKTEPEPASHEEAITEETEKITETESTPEPITERITETESTPEPIAEPITETERMTAPPEETEAVTEKEHKAVEDIAEGDYYLVSFADTTKCMHIADNSNQDGAHLILREMSHDNYQIFTVSWSEAAKAYLIKCSYNNRVLSVKDQSQEEGAALCQRVYHNEPDQYWVLEEAGNNCYFIRSVYQTYLDANTVEKKGIRLNHLADTDTQRWFLVPVED